MSQWAAVDYINARYLVLLPFRSGKQRRYVIFSIPSSPAGCVGAAKNFGRRSPGDHVVVDPDVERPSSTAGLHNADGPNTDVITCQDDPQGTG